MTAGTGRKERGLLFGFSFIWLMVLAIAGFAIGASAVMLGLLGIEARSQQAIEVWRTYANRTSDKEHALYTFVEHVGLGGMIDEYKSYVYSGRDDLAPVIYARAAAAIGWLDRYRQYEITAEEAEALDTLEAIVAAYHERVSVIGALHQAGAPVDQIDERARIDDAAADDALRVLTGYVRSERSTVPGGLQPKPEIIFEMRQALGFRGLSHAYRNLMLGPNEVDRSRALAALAALHSAVERYRNREIAEDEAAALAVIEHGLSAYEASIASGLFEQLRADGYNAAQIEAEAGVSSAPLLDALLALDMAVAREERNIRSDVATALSYVESSSKTMATLVIISALVMIAASIWLLGFRVARRIDRLTKSMRALSLGHVHAAIPSTADSDEIGEMSRTLLVFRDSIEANSVLARELAESSRLASLGALVAGMAHELNTPIGNAVSVASTLGENLRRLSDETASGKLRRSLLEDFIQRTGQALTLIERNLLHASRQIGSFKQLAVDQTGDQRRPFKLDSALADVVESMEPSARRARCTITLVADVDIDMDGYPGVLTQVICNLVENSLKHGFGDRAGGAVTITARRIDDTLSEVAVSDDGAGIPEELLPRIFDAFFTTRAGKGGSGLGLHIVNTLVSGPLGGEVAVESKPGAGTKFTIVLPNIAPQRAEAPGQHGDRVYYAAA